MNYPNAPGAAAEERESEIVKAMRALPRRSYDFDIGNILGLPTPVEATFWAVTKEEQDLAYSGALAYTKKKLDGATDEAAMASEVFQDAKAAFILAKIIREKNDPKYPVYVNGEVISGLLTPDRIAHLMRFALLARANDNPGHSSIEDDRIEAMAAVCAGTADTDIPERALAGQSWEWLAQAVVLLSLKLEGARADAAALRERLANAETPDAVVA